jgi:hypothetical protein
MSLEVQAGTFHATWNGKGEFFTGISTGDRVRVIVKFAGISNGFHASLQKLDSGNASLGIWDSQFHLLSDWEDAPEVNLIGDRK